MDRKGLWALTLSFAFLQIVGKHAHEAKPTPTIDLQKLADLVNNDPEVPWTAVVYPQFKGYSYQDFLALAGSLPEMGPVESNEDGTGPLNQLEAPNPSQIPDSFDARRKWGGRCPSLKEISFMKNCSACWAFAATEAFQDRYCILNKGAGNPRLSPNDILSCCGPTCNDRCNPSRPSKAWTYFKTNGLVTSSCDPYFMSGEECTEAWFSESECFPSVQFPVCHTTCSDSYPSTRRADKHFASSDTPYWVKRTVRDMQLEILKRGPIEVTIELFPDFMVFAGPVYTLSAYGREQGSLGYHCMKLIGWGIEDNLPYWLAANNWGTEFHDGGFVKILRGANMVRIETFPIAGLPRPFTAES